MIKFADIGIITLLVILIVTILYKLRKAKRTCGCSCSGCSSIKQCQK